MSNAKSVSAGRGLVFITAAKLWFMVAGYVVQFALPRALGSPERYGVWVIVLSVLSPVNNVMVTATIQGVSKFTSEIEERQGAVVRAALRLQALLGGGVALAFFLVAPLIASFEHDPTLTPYLQLATGVALAYAFYAVFVGAANGRKEFHKQAGLDMTYSTLRCLLIVGAAALTHSVLAAVGGFVGAAVLVLLLAIAVVGLGKPSRQPFDDKLLGALLRRRRLLPVDRQPAHVRRRAPAEARGLRMGAAARASGRRIADPRPTPTSRPASTARCRTWRAFPISSSSR